MTIQHFHSAVCAAFLASISLSTPAIAETITLEPDDYALGTDVSGISPYVSLSTIDGNPVYASTIHRDTTLAVQGNDTGPLGNAVFSSRPNENSEFLLDLYVQQPLSGAGLSITFNQPVASFSLLLAELFIDAGPCYFDPFDMEIYAPDGTLIETISMSIGGSNADGSLGDCDSMPDAWPYFTFTYSAATVGKVVLGGDSEPLSIDRLEFTLAVTPVAIDIKPGSERNSINLNSAGVVPVAILGSDTFDAATVDPTTVSLAGASVRLVGKSGRNSCQLQDVNLDGALDLVCQVYTAEFMIEEGETTAVLEAQTTGGQPIRGEDYIRVVPGN